MAYLFKKVEQNCVNDLVYIFKAAYGKDISSTLFEKKLNTSFAGLAYVGFIAYDSETKEPSAFYGVYPCLCDYNDQKYLVAQSGDTMTHPEITMLRQSRAFVQRLARAAVAHGRTRYHLHRRINWHHRYDADFYQGEASLFIRTSPGRYTLRAVDTDVPGHAYTDEVLDSADDARASRIEIPGDIDVYRVTLEAGVTYQIEANGTGSTPLTT